MGSSNRRKKRREAERLRAEAAAVAEVPRESAPAVLRLVRSEGESVPSEPVTPGRASEAVSLVREEIGSDSGSPETESRPALVAGTDARPVVTGLSRADVGRLVRRSYDASEINPILNDPSVFKYAAIDGMTSLDVSDIVADHRNVLLMAQRGGIIFCQNEPGSYEVHTNFLKAEKGNSGAGGGHSEAGNACLAAYRWMFTHTDCVELLTRIPAHNRAATVFSPLLGWVKEFERKNAWPSVSDGVVDMAFCALRYDDWVRKTPALMQSGRDFHRRLEEEFTRHGKTEEQHPDEDCHDLHVGACIEMILGGQLDKAVALYNRWARFAGYGQIAAVSHDPPVIDIGNALLQITGDTFKAVLVR